MDDSEPSGSTWLTAAPLRLGGTTSLVEALVAMQAARAEHVVVVEGDVETGLFSLSQLRRMAASVGTLAPEWQLSALTARATQCAPDAELAELVDRLGDVGAVLIPGADGVIGILTSSALLADVARAAEPFLIIADIEESIRYILDRRIPLTDRASLFTEVLGGGRRRTPPQALDELSFGDYQFLLAHERVWPRFEDIFRSPELTLHRLNMVRLLRNQMFHFRGDLDRADVDELKAQRWWFREAAKRTSTGEMRLIDGGEQGRAG